MWKVDVNSMLGKPGREAKTLKVTKNIRKYVATS